MFCQHIGKEFNISEETPYNIDDQSINNDEAHGHSKDYDLEYLEELAGSDIVFKSWIEELRMQAKTKEDAQRWYNDKVAKYGRRKIGYFSCVLSRALYMPVLTTAAVKSGSVQCTCEADNREFYK